MTRPKNIHKKIKIHQHFIAFNLIYLLILIEKSNRSGRRETLFFRAPWYHCDSTFPLLLLFLFFLILNHAIFIIPFANHRWLCKHEKGVERRNIKIIIITRPTIVVHMLKASFTSINPSQPFLHYSYSNTAPKATTIFFSIFLMKHFLIIHQMHSHVAFNL